MKKDGKLEERKKGKYNSFKLKRLPISEGISPENPLIRKFLQKRGHHRRVRAEKI